ncbi:helix-turn-helix transcriptional regulator [Colwellia sp. RSH04]|uniref:helix-turn-helix domain-containing protein n=1 Tax=Colwellia sp. RSH04 TaxID=2305464 RepID=UPI000E593D5F|nr:helix-turn-helix transcriptional regulator [Colwellia sp. RSH04]RHW76477.1 LuxR family transcriptional regulator [Colwellia sp. RSH04]
MIEVINQPFSVKGMPLSLRETEILSCFSTEKNKKQAKSMTLSSWSKRLVETTFSIGKPNFYALLSSLLEEITYFDEIVILHFKVNQKPTLLLQKNIIKGDDFEKYLNSAHVLDPFYRMGIDYKTKGFFRLSDISPNDYSIFESYYNSYFRHLKIIDEIGYLIQLPEQGGFIHIEMANFEGSPLFLAYKLQQFSELFETIEELVCQHLQSYSYEEDSCAEHNYIEEFHRQFATKVCTPREHEVVLLMLQGYSVKSMAQKMSLGIETIKMHRKNIYMKLSIGSQPELLALFIDLLVVTEPPILDDPLLLKIEKDKKSARDARLDA